MIQGRIRFYTDALFLLLFLVVIPVILQKEKKSGEAQTIGRLYFEADRRRHSISVRTDYHYLFSDAFDSGRALQ